MANSNILSNSNQTLLMNSSVSSKYRVAQENGQRIFGPPLDCKDDIVIPEKGTEVFVGKIPRDCFENELIPLFEQAGRIFKMRLMIDFSGMNRGYGFVQYFNRDDAKRAIKMLNKIEIRKKWSIGVMLSKNNNRLFFGNLPNNLTKKDLANEVSKHTSGIKNVIYYGGSHRPNGFGFVEYENHKMTALARRKFFPGSILLFGRQPKVDWAKSDEDIEEDLSNDDPKKYILYVRFFKPTINEDGLKQFFSLKHNDRILQVSKVKKVRNFAFVHYLNAQDAQFAYDYFQSINLGKTAITDDDQELEIKWAKNKPQTPSTKTSSSLVISNSTESKDKEFFSNKKSQPLPLFKLLNCNGDNLNGIKNINPFVRNVSEHIFSI